MYKFKRHTPPYKNTGCIGRPACGKGNGKKFSKINAEEVIKLRAQGVLLTTIAKTYGVSYQAIQQSIKRHEAKG